MSSRKHTFDDSIAEMKELHELDIAEYEREREARTLNVRNLTVKTLAEAAAQRWSGRLVNSSITELLVWLSYEVWDACEALYTEDKNE